jgi:peptidoglycan/LPS O-acetylase OafA/YrhL
VVENGLYVPLFALLIVAIANSARPLLSGAVWTRLGMASYALYIIHMPIWGMYKFAGEIGVIGPVEQDMGVYLSFLGVTIIGALLVHRYVEEPSRSALRSVLEEGFMPALRRLVPESGWPHGSGRRSFGPDRAEGPAGGSGARGAGRPESRPQFEMRLE